MARPDGIDSLSGPAKGVSAFVAVIFACATLVIIVACVLLVALLAFGWTFLDLL